MESCMTLVCIDTLSLYSYVEIFQNSHFIFLKILEFNLYKGQQYSFTYTT